MPRKCTHEWGVAHHYMETTQRPLLAFWPFEWFVERADIMEARQLDIAGPTLQTSQNPETETLNDIDRANRLLLYWPRQPQELGGCPVLLASLKGLSQCYY